MPRRQNPRPTEKRDRRQGGTVRSPARKPRAAQKATKKKASKRVWRLSTRTKLAMVAVALLFLIPAVRSATAEGLRAGVAQVEAIRAAEARARLVATYSTRYRISTELAEAVLLAAEEEGVRPDLAFRLVRVESSFRERAVSPVGALGLTQLMPATAGELQPGITREQIFHRDTNLRLGFRYFGQLLERYDGDVEEALHAYNRGMGTVARIRASGGDPANGYADAVLGERGASPAR